MTTNPEVEHLKKACLHAANQLDAQRDGALEEAATMVEHWEALSCDVFEAIYGKHETLPAAIRGQKEIKE